jgi:elongation factor Ts
LQISADVVKELRGKTGAGVMDCKKALQDVGGDMQKAAEMLKERGLALAQKKAERAANQGLIECYVHQGGQIGVMVEVNCETDFVARTAEFKELAHDIALQIAAMSPKYIHPDEVAQGADADPQTLCLLLQPFIKDPTKNIQDLIAETIAKVGENIKVRRFCRFELGY